MTGCPYRITEIQSDIHRPTFLFMCFPYHVKQSYSTGMHLCCFFVLYSDDMLTDGYFTDLVSTLLSSCWLVAVAVQTRLTAIRPCAPPNHLTQLSMSPEHYEKLYSCYSEPIILVTTKHNHWQLSVILLPSCSCYHHCWAWTIGIIGVELAKIATAEDGPWSSVLVVLRIGFYFYWFL